jgi:TonB family protein
LLKIAASRIEPDLAPAPLFLKKRHLRERVAAIVKGANMSKSRLILTMIAVLAALPLVAVLLAWQIPLQAAPQEVRDSAGVDVQTGPFKILHRDPVLYPEEARTKAVSGDVFVSLSVNSQGEVTDARIVSGPDELRGAVLRSVLGWHFSTDAGALPPRLEVSVRFNASAAAPPANSLPRIAAEGGVPALTVGNIDFSELPETLREKVERAAPIRSGDAFSGDRALELARAIQGIDRHLVIRSTSIHDGKVDLRVTLGGPSSVSGTTSATTPQRIRVGGNVQAVNLVNKVTPIYPPLAKQARVQGTVRFQALIGKDGHIINLELVTGHPLLVPPATDAVKQWVYKPTLLNGEPVEVITQIDVNFTLLE